jgi:hypothetical protein
MAKTREAFSSVLPITIIVLLAVVILVPIPAGTLLLFLGGSALLIIGMGFFTLGADMFMMPLGEGLGTELTYAVGISGKTTAHPALRKLKEAVALTVVLIVTFVIGLVVTLAEPDLAVLAEQVSAVPQMTLMVTVGVGVGIFLVIAVARSLIGVPLRALLLLFYIATFTLAFFANKSFLPVAFDSGGVTTGPITVPFILSLGVGVASLRSDKNGQGDSFGLVALCSVGPILAVLILGFIFDPSGASVETQQIATVNTSRDVVAVFAEASPDYAWEVGRALGCVLLVFLLFELVTRRYKLRQAGRMLVGFVYTFIGLVVFLTGVNVGFIPVGQLLGEGLGGSPAKWILVPLGVVIGYFIVAAEPAVHVLNKQVEDISSGAISQRLMNTGLSAGMAIALAITMVRILAGIPIIYILIPGYAIALLLTFFVPKIFTGIAFDSGGVCSGAMTSSFLLPLAMGVAKGTGGDIMQDAFGIVAVVAMTPLVVIQLIGFVHAQRVKAAERAQTKLALEAADGVILEYSINER